MIRTLLIWGLITGLLAGVAAFGVASLVGEPPLDAAIAYEESKAASEPTVAADGHTHEHGTEVSRETQSTVGLLTATIVYGAAFGGLFALVFAFGYGRIADASPRVTAAWFALGGFVTVFLVPFAKYPATPPAIGDPETIGERTLLYFGMMVIAWLAAFIAVRTRAWLLKDHPDLATAGGIAVFLIVVIAAALALPSHAEIPADFPATELWQFRVGTVAIQATLWSVLAFGFGLAAQRVMTRDAASSVRGSVGSPATS